MLTLLWLVMLQTKKYGHEISWEFGNCSSEGTDYANDASYDIECCQPPGDYTMKCKDSYGDGWHGGYIQVGSSPTKICEDFKEEKPRGYKKEVIASHPEN